MAVNHLPIFLILILIIFGYITWATATYYIDKRNEARTDPYSFYVPELGGYLSNVWKYHIALVRTFKDASVKEEYWGLWSSMTRKHANAPVDSVIHALGKTRQKFANAMQRLPDVIVTTTRTMSPAWQPWNISTNWWFYKPLMENYRAASTSPTTMIWRKKAHTTPWPVVPCTVVGDRLHPALLLTTQAAGYYEITLHYQTQDLSTRTLLLVRNNLTDALDVNGFLSLDPYATLSRFPAALSKPSEGLLNFKLITATDDFTKVHIIGCSARKILFEHPDVLPALS